MLNSRMTISATIDAGSWIKVVNTKTRSEIPAVPIASNSSHTNHGADTDEGGLPRAHQAAGYAARPASALRRNQRAPS